MIIFQLQKNILNS